MQVVFVVLGGLAVAGASAKTLIPKNDSKGPVDPNVYKYLRCDVCNTELPYNKELDGKRCPRCQPPNTGFFYKQKDSLKDLGRGSYPLRWFYTAVGLDFLVVLAVVVYVLYRPYTNPADTYYVCTCTTCNQRLRFREISLGELGQCPRCKSILRFPGEDEAVTEDAAAEWEREATIAAFNEDSELV
ncbi:hypothetical protein [Fimbriiglobus ruber]|uniref:Uncharacterized protein n=1 Tax=Fimbriiglobus ruber TaxID=1908690 RepID=A0A225E3A6_9BACT|nr:hypothetical protein [Fimbriiglobus ruber]OWK43969.1 hypothetical protein FRUB_03568 [Fimbriiglobus ruber]